MSQYRAFLRLNKLTRSSLNENSKFFKVHEEFFTLFRERDDKILKVIRNYNDAKRTRNSRKFCQTGII